MISVGYGCCQKTGFVVSGISWGNAVQMPCRDCMWMILKGVIKMKMWSVLVDLCFF